MPEVNDIQQQTDVEQAKAKLQQVAETRESRMDPRAEERTALTRRQPPANNQEKDIHPVAAKPKKKSFWQKLKGSMFSEDVSNGSVTDYVFFKVFIPAVKRVLSDMACSAVNMALGLDIRPRRDGNTHVSNASLYRDRNYNRSAYDTRGYDRRNAVSEYEWDEDTAKDIFNQMSDIIDRYGECSLADAYAIMGLGTQIRTTDRNWGWTTMRGADVVPVNSMRDSWIVDMPAARPLK